MAGPLKPKVPPRVRCEICLREIPRSEARSAEGRDYVVYFCGLECFEKWRDGRGAPRRRG